MRAELINVVERYLHGLGGKNLGHVPFADDVTFESPLSPPIAGVKAVTGFLTGLFPAVKGVSVKQFVVEAPYVVAVFDFHTTFGVIPVCDVFRVEGGRLKGIRPYYDPRPITHPAPAAVPA
jgi:limonene-1,2-epoxide hydrolase